MTVGILGDLFNGVASSPITLTNSSLTIFTICCAGVKLSNTSAPTARVRTVLTKSLTTLKLTSDSNKAKRISRITSLTSDSLTFPLRRNFPIAFWRRSVNPSNAI